jgi:hypothetical protein
MTIEAVVLDKNPARQPFFVAIKRRNRFGKWE